MKEFRQGHLEAKELTSQFTLTHDYETFRRTGQERRNESWGRGEEDGAKDNLTLTRQTRHFRSESRGSSCKLMLKYLITHEKSYYHLQIINYKSLI